MARSERLTVRVAPSTARRLADLAEAQGLTMSQVLRRGIRAVLERDRRRGTELDELGAGKGPGAVDARFRRELDRVSRARLPSLDEELLRQAAFRVNLAKQDHPAAAFARQVYLAPAAKRLSLRQSARRRLQILGSRAEASRLVREWLDEAAEAALCPPAVSRPDVEPATPGPELDREANLERLRGMTERLGEEGG